MNERTSKGRVTALNLRRAAWHRLLDALDDLEAAMHDAEAQGIQIDRSRGINNDALADLQTSVLAARPRNR